MTLSEMIAHDEAPVRGASRDRTPTLVEDLPASGLQAELHEAVTALRVYECPGVVLVGLNPVLRASVPEGHLVSLGWQLDVSQARSIAHAQMVAEVAR